MAEYKKADVLLESVTADAGSCLRDLMIKTYALVWKDDFPTFLYHLIKKNKHIKYGKNGKPIEVEASPLADRASIVKACSAPKVDGLLKLCRNKNSDVICDIKSGEELLEKLSQPISGTNNSWKYENFLKDLENNIYEKWINNYFHDIKEDEILHILSGLDLSACFKVNSITKNIDNEIHQQTHDRLFPRMHDINSHKSCWVNINQNALDIRNEMIGHTQGQTKVDDWKSACRFWEEIASLLNQDRPETDTQYQAFTHAIENGNKQLDLSVIPWKDIVEASGMSKSSCRHILCDIYNRTEDGNNVLCESLEAALNNIHREIQFNKKNELEKEQLIRQQEIQEAKPGISKKDLLTEIQEETIQKQVKEVPNLNLLSNYKGGFINTLQLRELCQTHTILLDSSLLLSELAENFIIGDLMKAAGGMPANGKALFVVESSSRFEVFKQKRENKTGGYYLMNDFLCGQLRLIRYVGIPNPLQDKNEAMLEFIEEHKQQRICIFTCGNPGFVKMINHNDYPLCTIADVTKNWSDANHPNVLLYKNTLPLISQFDKKDVIALLKKEAPSDSVTIHEEEKSAISVDNSDSEKNVTAEKEQNSKAQMQKEQPQKNQTSKEQRPQTKPNFSSSEIHVKETLYTEKHYHIRLVTPLIENGNEAKGGEGTLYVTDQKYYIAKNTQVPVVAKIYHKELRTPDRYRKILYMVTNPVKMRNVCWPINALFDSENNFVGFTMIQAPQECLQLGSSIFKIGQPAVREKYFSSWQKIDLVKVALTVAKTMETLHKNNILMGDINPCNFLINPQRSGEVYFVDCDSYQVGEFPCPVGREEFTHPGIADRLGAGGKVEYGTFMRTLDDEQYSLAILLFSILMNGHHPCDSKEQNNLPLAMKNKEFPYSKSWRVVPDPGCWKMWKNMPKRIRDPFEATFKEWKTTSAEDWRKLLSSYQYLIKNNGFCNDIFPTKYFESNPDNPMFVDLVCPDCGKEFNYPKTKYSYGKKVVCMECQNYYDWLDVQLGKIELTCSKCQKRYLGYPSERELAEKTGAKLICPDCRFRRQQKKWR